ncbi:putative 54 kDa protein [Dissostichus eleginoides]|uniref:54 kDa protein n=1 Tax=Dissostichus eleginoides TaxID=100907 RepID=A0AAD9BCP5_DISEL|nr:putative 54 kDa protein [Dissostichus eleginoides]
MTAVHFLHFCRQKCAEFGPTCFYPMQCMIIPAYERVGGESQRNFPQLLSWLGEGAAAAGPLPSFGQARAHKDSGGYWSCTA